MGIRVKQFKEIDYPQPHTGKGQHNAKHKSQQNTKSSTKNTQTHNAQKICKTTPADKPTK